MKLKVWFLETRPQFLLLSVVLAFLGTTIAWYDGDFHLGYAMLAFLGLLLCHISVNVLNDYFDYKSGIDLEAKRTPFSGGATAKGGPLGFQVYAAFVVKVVVEHIDTDVA